MFRSDHAAVTAQNVTRTRYLTFIRIHLLIK